ncbi:MAG: hypothetical protein K2X34_02890 [Hyphomonadaceae bacterium]|nr:hypothetical protein [Hyphomonadaceae bacterium]MBY0565657.1 hypothetical protein [Hyphomonadaceae bacterium]
MLALLALIGSTSWMVRSTRLQPNANAWAKAALSLAVSLPLAWIATAQIVMGKLRGIPDGDMPTGLVEQMSSDVLQMQTVALLTTMLILGCVGVTARRTYPGAPTV